MEPKETASKKTTYANAEYEERIALFTATKKYRRDDKHTARERADPGCYAASGKPIVLAAKKAVALSKARFVFAQI